MTGPDTGVPGEQRNDEQGKPRRRRRQPTRQEVERKAVVKAIGDDERATEIITDSLAGVEAWVGVVMDFAEPVIAKRQEHARETCAACSMNVDLMRNGGWPQMVRGYERMEADLAAARRTLDEAERLIEAEASDPSSDWEMAFIEGWTEGMHNALSLLRSARVGRSPDTETRDKGLCGDTTQSVAGLGAGPPLVCTLPVGHAGVHGDDCGTTWFHSAAVPETRDKDGEQE